MAASSPALQNTARFLGSQGTGRSMSSDTIVARPDDSPSSSSSSQRSHILIKPPPPVAASENIEYTSTLLHRKPFLPNTDVLVNVSSTFNHDESSEKPQEDPQFETKKRIILALGRCLLQFGSPSHRIEETLKHACKVLSVDATFTIVPDLILVSLVYPASTSSSNTNTNTTDTAPHPPYPETLTIKSAVGFDVGKLVKMTKTMNALYKGKQNPEQCLMSLQDIIDAPPSCGNFALCFSFSAIGFTATACMFDGTWIDATAATILGLLVALLFIASIKIPAYGPVYEVSSCIIVGLAARLLHQYTCFITVGLSPILILLPGYGMTMAVMEILAHQVTTGTIRLAYAVIYAFLLAYGLQIGSSVYMAINPDIPDEGVCGDPVSPWYYLLLFPIMSISIGLAYGSTRQQWASQTCCAAIGFCVLFFLGRIVSDPQVLSTIAAFAMGLYANFALKITGEPPLAPLCVGITLLVPGSLGVRHAYALLHNNDVTQVLYPILMLQVSLGLAVGLHAAAIIVYPTSKIRSLYISL